nr:MAG TPA: hypothetical protein [Caudoviricetes sp.]
MIIRFVVREGIEPSLFPISLQLFTTLKFCLVHHPYNLLFHKCYAYFSTI